MRFFPILLMMLLPCAVFTQGNKPPEWINEQYPVQFKNSFLQMIVVKTEVTRDAMFDKAKEMLANERNLATGERVIFSEGETQSQSGLTIYAQKLDEWIDDDKEIGYFIFQIKNPNTTYEKVSYDKRYQFSPRVFIPGMAQIHKGSKLKGTLFILGEVAAIGGIVTCEMLRASNVSKISSTHNVSDWQYYIDQADNMQNMRNICIAGAVAVYAWNVIDGMVAKGKPHFHIAKAEIRFMPSVFPAYMSMNYGIGLSVNF